MYPWFRSGKLQGGENLGSAPMRRFAVTSAILLFFMPNANAQNVTLTCQGTLYEYGPSAIVATIPPGTTYIDFDKKRIATPTGVYLVTALNDTDLVFGEIQGALKVFGTLDRTTGKMRIFWRTPEEHTKMRAGLPSKMSRFAELICLPAKRLF